MSTPIAATPVGDQHPAPTRARQIIGASCADLRARQDDLILAVHQQVLAMVPAVPSGLARNGRPLCRRLVLAVLEAAVPGQPLGRAEAMLAGVGADDYADGIPGDRHGPILQALLRAVRDCVGAEWTTAVGSGWAEYLGWIRRCLVAGAAAAQEADPAHREAWTPRAGGRPPGAAPAGGRRPIPAAPARQDHDREQDDDGPGYGELMVAMTLTPRRARRRRPDPEDD